MDAHPVRNIALETISDYRTGRETSPDVLLAALEGILNALVDD